MRATRALLGLDGKWGKAVLEQAASTRGGSASLPGMCVCSLCRFRFGPLSSERQGI